MSYGADASGQPLQPGEDEEGVCGGYAGASGGKQAELLPEAERALKGRQVMKEPERTQRA